MKRLFGILLAVSMILGIAGTAAASFEAGNLIAVFYNENDNTVAYDLGVVDPSSTITVDTTGLLNYFETITSYTDVRVGIFAAEAGYSNWFATTSSEEATMSTASILSFGAGTEGMYGTYGSADDDDDGISVVAASDMKAYDVVMNSNSNSPGYYAGFNADATIGEAVLTAEGDFTMYVHNFDVTTYDADALITVTTSPVPVPGAVWLMASGLLGFLGIRRKNA